MLAWGFVRPRTPLHYFPTTFHRKTFVNTLLSVLALCVALVGVPSTVIAQDTIPGVSSQDEQFSPVMAHASSTMTFTWRNDGAEQHTITADDGSFDSGPLDPTQTFEYRFTTPGTYNYYCSLHGGLGGQGMAGVIVVS